MHISEWHPEVSVLLLMCISFDTWLASWLVTQNHLERHCWKLFFKGHALSENTVQVVAVLPTLSQSFFFGSFHTPLATLFKKATSYKSSVFFWCYWRLLETLTWKHVSFLLFSASSKCCRGPSRPVLAQQSLPAAVRAGDVQPFRVQNANRTWAKPPLADVNVLFFWFKINRL